MSRKNKAVAIRTGVIVGTIAVAAGIYLGAKYIPYAVEEARHRARIAQLDHRPELVRTKKALAVAKKKVSKAFSK